MRHTRRASDQTFDDIVKTSSATVDHTSKDSSTGTKNLINRTFGRTSNKAVVVIHVPRQGKKKNERTMVSFTQENDALMSTVHAVAPMPDPYISLENTRRTSDQPNYRVIGVRTATVDRTSDLSPPRGKETRI